MVEKREISRKLAVEATAIARTQPRHSASYFGILLQSSSFYAQVVEGGVVPVGEELWRMNLHGEHQTKQFWSESEEKVFLLCSVFVALVVEVEYKDSVCLFLFV